MTSLLTPTDQARRTNSPPLQELVSPIPRIGPRGQLGRGWGVSAEKLRQLNDRAAQMRRNPTEPEKRVWYILSNGQMDGHKFRRQSVIGYFIADFLCPAKALIIEVDGDTHDEAKDRVRDDVLASFGFRVIRVTNHDVMSNIEGVWRLISDVLAESADRWPTPHPNPSPEWEGLEEEVSLEGGVG